MTYISKITYIELLNKCLEYDSNKDFYENIHKLTHYEIPTDEDINKIYGDGFYTLRQT